MSASPMVKCGSCAHFVRDGKCRFFDTPAGKAKDRPFEFAPFRKGWRGDMKVTHHGMPDEGAGLSWDGFNVRGDAQSVREVRRLVEFHAARSPERPNAKVTG